jgi:hypothetical protein
VTELEILHRRRELVMLSAQMQRATIVRRLDNVTQHPARIALGMASKVASAPFLWALASRVLFKAFPVTRFFNRYT